jgi:hypothetical protein
MKKRETYRYDEKHPKRRGPFHLSEHFLLKSDSSKSGILVRLTKAKRAARYGCDRCFQVMYCTSKEIRMNNGSTRLKRWNQIVIQTPSRREAYRVFKACLRDIATGHPLKKKTPRAVGS